MKKETFISLSSSKDEEWRLYRPSTEMYLELGMGRSTGRFFLIEDLPSKYKQIWLTFVLLSVLPELSKRIIAIPFRLEVCSIAV